MRFLHLRLQDFRNITFAELDLAPARSFLLGPNGQGKSNLLEALGLVTALRSFRTQQTSALRRQGAQGYVLVYTVEHESLGQTELEIRAGGQGHQVWLDGERVSRLGDFIGRFPVVPLSAGDLMLLRGAPSERRRFLDLTLSAMDGEYYQALRHYHRGIAGRNRLLKRGGSAAELSAFEAELAPQALQLSVKRKAGVARLQTHLSDAYTSIAEADEGPELQFKPNLECETVAALREVFEQSRTRDQAIGSTQPVAPRNLPPMGNNEAYAWRCGSLRPACLRPAWVSRQYSWLTMYWVSWTHGVKPVFGGPARVLGK
jgi:DNA replication and repair protein RecF